MSRATAATAAGPNRATNSNVTADDSHNEFSWQSSVGWQHQLGSSVSVEADYVWIAQRNVENLRQSSVTYNAQTGVNYPWTDPTRRAYPNWNTVNFRFFDGRSDYHALETGITKRFGEGWQLSASYTLAGEWVGRPDPLLPGCQNPATAQGPVCDVPLALAPDLAGIRYLAGSQRNRLSINGLWQLPYQFQFSGLYLFGDNGKATTTPGVDVRLNNTFNGRLRPNGTLIPFNNFDLPSLHRIDMRLQRRFRFTSRMSADALVEVFNAFNHLNYDPSLFVLNEASASFGRPQPSSNLAYQPRMVQLGVRFTF